MRRAGVLVGLALLLGGGLAGWQWTLFKPQIDTVQEHLARARAGLAAAKATSSQRVELERNLAERTSLLAQLREAFPETLVVDEFQRSLTRVALANAVELQEFSSSNLHHEFFEEARVEVRLRGTSDAVDQLMASVLIEPRHVAWRTEEAPDERETQEETQPGDASGAGDEASAPAGKVEAAEEREVFVESFSIYAIPAPPPVAGRSCRVDTTSIWMPPFGARLERGVRELSQVCSELESLGEITVLVEELENLVVETGAIQAIRQSIVAEHR